MNQTMEHAAMTNPTSSKAWKILVVEDLKIAAKINKITLSKLGCEVVIATSGHEAIDEFSNNLFDLVFMDIGLPDMNGTEVQKRLREIDQAKGGYTPIVALSSHTNKHTVNTALEAGMDDYLSKPLTKESALKIINNLNQYNKKA